MMNIVGPLPLLVPLPDEGEFIFVDGGVRHRGKREGTSIGDGDSAQVPMALPLSTNKDFSDFAGALKLINSTAKHIALYGFTGGRWDHQLAIWFEIHHWLVGKKDVRVIIPPHFHFFSSGEFELEIYGKFGIFIFSPTQVQLSGACQYQLCPNEELRALSSHGVGNQGQGVVKIVTHGPLLLAQGCMEK